MIEGWAAEKLYGCVVDAPPESVTETLKLYVAGLLGVKLKFTVPGEFVYGGMLLPVSVGVEYGAVTHKHHVRLTNCATDER